MIENNINNMTTNYLTFISEKSNNSIYFRNIGSISEEKIKNIWEALGRLISKYLREGRGLNIPNLGIFTFKPPEVILNGVNNPLKRDKQQKLPIFLVKKDMVKGKVINSGVWNYNKNTMRSYNQQGSFGNTQILKLGFFELGLIAGCSKFDAEKSLNQIIYQLKSDIIKNKKIKLVIPYVGILYFKENIIGICFEKGLIKDSFQITKKNIDQNTKKILSNNFFTVDKKDCLDLHNNGHNDINTNYKGRFMNIDNSGENYLNELGISLNNNNLWKYSNYKKFDSFVKTNCTNYSVNNKNKTGYSCFKNNNTNYTTNNFEINKLKNKINNFESKHDKLLIKLNNCLKNNQVSIKNLFYSIKNNKEIIKEKQMNFKKFKNLILNNITTIKEDEIDLIFKNLVDKNGNISKNKLIRYFDINIDSAVKEFIKYLKENKISINNILIDLDLKQRDKLDYLHLLDIIKKSDPFKANTKKEEIAKLILKGKDHIKTKNLIKLLSIKNEYIKDDFNNINKLLNRIKLELININNSQLLEKEFETYDNENNYLINWDIFNNILLKNKNILKISEDEVEILVDYFNNGENKINYLKFLDKINYITNKNIKNIFNNKNLKVSNYEFIKELRDYLSNKNLGLRKFLAKILNIFEEYNEEQLKYKIIKVPIDIFIKYCDDNLKNINSISKIAKDIDIDGDKFISFNDLNTFINSNKLVENSDNVLMNTLKNNLNINTEKNLNKNTLFPLETIKIDKISQILKIIRNKLSVKKMSIYNFFYSLDTNKDNVLTYDEIENNLNIIYDFNLNAKKTFFSYLDHQNIGLVNYKNFENKIKSYKIQTNDNILMDNFNNQIDLIKKIITWKNSNRYTTEDLFRVIDQDFDSYININDLKSFLIRVIKIDKKYLTVSNIERLFKLINTDNKESITLENFKLFINKNLNKSVNKDYWLNKAKSFIKNYIKNNYSNVSDCYKEITNLKININFEDFIKWLEKKQIIKEFNLTSNLQEKLFSYLDPHKKGHLTIIDWKNLFNDTKDGVNIIKLFRFTISEYFSSIKDIYYYINNGNPIEFKKFKSKLELYFKDKFNKNYEFIFNIISENKKMLEFKDFKRFFSKIKFNGNLAKNIKKIKNNKNEIYIKDILNKFETYLDTSNKTLNQVFTQMDSCNSGKLNIIQFKNAIKNLKINITAKELDSLINLCYCNDNGYFDWKFFVKLFEENKEKSKLYERVNSKLYHIKDLINYYLISPWDAYKKFNIKNDNKLLFEEFKCMIDYLYTTASELKWEFRVLYDLFSFIDIRKDGVIDEKEWQQVFKKIETNKVSSNIIANPNGLKISNFECNKDFTRVVNIISKNRKYFFDVFNSYDNRNIKLTTEIVKNIFKKFLKSKYGIVLDQKVYNSLINFAADNDIINIRYLFNKYKERSFKFNSQPHNIINRK